MKLVYRFFLVECMELEKIREIVNYIYVEVRLRFVIEWVEFYVVDK